MDQGSRCDKRGIALTHFGRYKALFANRRQRGREFAIGLGAIVAVILVAQLSIGFAASPAIGVAVARGSFQLDASGVSGTGTIFDGTMVETGKATSELKLQSGVRMVLDTGTRGQVYRDHLLLQKGTGQVSNGANYSIQARSLQIEPVSEGAAKVTLSRDGNRVLVAALGSGLRVRNSRGILVADVPAGHALEFEPQDGGASAPSTLTGILTKKNGHYYLTDQTAGITVELQGSGLDKEVGKKIEVVGVIDPSASPASGASQVIRVSQVHTVANAATHAGMAVGTKAIIAGVVIAGAATGTAVGLTRDDSPSSNPKPPISQ